MKRCSLFLFFFLLFVLKTFTNEQIHSYYDEYYDCLSVLGMVDRPYLNYKSFSTDSWEPSDSLGHPWKGSSSWMGSNSLTSDIAVSVLDTEFYNSYNSDSLYGINVTVKTTGP